jgi:RHS repeat-associated protein
MNQGLTYSIQGYESFGSLLPGRNYSSSDYRWGFNGKENDNEVHNATGTFQDYGMRAYDPRIARFISVDPIASKYPELTPYQFASNTPIQAVDWDGLEARVVVTDKTEDGKAAAIKLTIDVQVINQSKERSTPEVEHILSRISETAANTYSGSIRVVFLGLFGRKVNVSGEINFTEGKGPMQLYVKDNIPGAQATTAVQGGSQRNTFELAVGAFANPKDPSETRERTDGEMSSSGVHEIAGHAVGLGHFLRRTWNLMSSFVDKERSADDQSHLRKGQIRRAIKEVLRDRKEGKLKDL